MVGGEDESEACSHQGAVVGSGEYQWPWKLGWVSLIFYAPCPTFVSMELLQLLTSLRDEILYNAKLHPEQYSDTFSSEQVKQLHASIIYICQTAVDLLADSEKFPEEWLFKHRWGKGKKDAPKTLPNGEKITFLTVGGRTSCVVLSVQKKSGPVAGDLKENEKVADGEEAGDAKESTAKGRGRKRKATVEPYAEDVDDPQAEQGAPSASKSKRRSKAVVGKKTATS